jgi:endonuclease-3
MTIKERYSRTLELLDKAIPTPETELHYDTPFHLLLAVILSAQCTDKRVNTVTPALFEAYPTPEALAAATPDEVYQLIKSVSYPNNKTRSLIGAAQTIVDEFNGILPDNIDDLMRIPGVGRKTANVMLAVVWNRAAMAVDTHVFRVSERIGLTTNSRTPLTTEKALIKHIPPELVPKAHHWLILHGRYVCKARRPDCLNCTLTEVCRYYQKNG